METRNKLSLVYVVICDDIRWERGDKVSLMGLFDTIHVEKVPAVHPKLVIVAAWSGATGKYKSEIILESPDGKTSSHLGTADFTLPDEKRAHRHFAVVYNWKIQSLGTYQALIKLDGNLVRSAPLRIVSTGKVQHGLTAELTSPSGTTVQ